MRLTITAADGSAVPVDAAIELAERLRERLKIRVAVDEASFRHPTQSGPSLRGAATHGAAPAAGEDGPSSSDALIDSLMERFPDSDDGWTLGLTANDLAAPGRSCVFGEATLGGRWAVVSLARLGPPGRASPRLGDRLWKEALHELGHLGGLDHCSESDGCVMTLSSTVAAIDAKSSEFCARCGAAFLQRRG